MLERNEISDFDVIGDIHGCFYEMIDLVEKLGYVENDNGLYEHPDDRMLVFVGDITDRGHYNSMSFQWVYRHWKNDKCLLAQGNHDNKLFRWMKGNPVSPGHGLQKTITEFEKAWPFDMPKEEMGPYLLDNVPGRISLDDGNVVVAHAYNCESDRCMYGPRGGPDNSRIPWWEDYDEDPFVIFGHYWFKEGKIMSHCCCVDTSCVEGHQLTALRWPEKELVQVDAREVYHE